MAACRGGDLIAVQYLIDHGADVRSRMQSGYTALYAAASWPGNVNIVTLLLEKGADANAKVEVTQPTNKLYTPVLAASMHGDADSLKRLLERGGKVNTQGGDFGRSPLLVAAATGSASTIQLLLAAGADVNSQDALGNSPLQWARRRGETSVAGLLEKAGTERRPDPRKAEGAGRLQTALDGDSVKRAWLRACRCCSKTPRRFLHGERASRVITRRLSP